MPPISAWVVETGQRIQVAVRTKPAAPTKAAKAASTPSAEALRKKPPPNKVLKASPRKIAAQPPAAVPATPSNHAVRGVVTPLPAKAATPFETSFAPFAHPSAMVASNNAIAKITLSA